MRKLYVTQTTLTELKTNGWSIYGLHIVHQHYVRCNKTGTVNWDKTLLYTARELMKRGNVHVIDRISDISGSIQS